MSFRTTLLSMLLFFAMTVSAQDDYWEPQTNFTGYIGTEFNYFSGLKGHERDYAIALSEAGFLSSYQPTRDLTITGVLVYRPNLSFEQMLNELNAQYRINNNINFKAGRFLTPLSPMNTYYYAPVNNSATLPMIITNHEFFPLNMDAVSVNGEIGDDFRISYNAFAGGFRNSLWQGSGALGFFAQENDYFQQQLNPITDELGYDMVANPNESLQFGGGGHVGLNLNNFITLGIGTFNSRESITTTMKLIRFEDENASTMFSDHYVRTQATTSSVKKESYGGNLLINHSTLKLTGEYWQTSVKMDGMPSMNYKGAFVELSNNFFTSIGSVTPYVRYEFHQVPITEYEFDFETFDFRFLIKGQNYYRYTTGINYKPSFETTFKMEYVYYEYSDLDLGGIVLTAIFSF